MAQDPTLVGGEGPKTPISPRARSGTLKAVDREKKLGHRRVGEGGEVTYKKVKKNAISCGTFLHHCYLFFTNYRFIPLKLWALSNWVSVMQWVVWLPNQNEIFLCRTS